MNDRVHTVVSSPAKRRRWPAVVALIAVLGLVAAIAGADAPYLFKVSTLRREIAHQLRATTGLVLESDGAADFVLFPQPHVRMANLHMSDPSGTLTIDADAFAGNVRLLPLLVGRLEIAATTLERPRLVIDLDGKPMPADSTIGRALRPDAGLQPSGRERLGIVTLIDGVATIKSKGLQRDTVVEAINVTVDWRDIETPATLTGTIVFHDTPADVAAWVGQPSGLMRGDHSAIALRIQSAPLDLSANGDFGSAPFLKFHGTVSATAPALGPALALAGYGAPLPAPFANVSVTSDTTVGGGTVDLPNLRLRIDGNDYEGTLAYQAGPGKPALSGTLATEQLSIAPFLERAPPLLDADRHWGKQKIALDVEDRINLDLRISASHLSIAPLVISDAALAVMTRDNRTEIALVEGKAYGGSVKGRASLGLSDKGLSLRASGALTEADASALSWDVFGRQRAAGTLSASINLETEGDTPAGLIQAAHGWAKGQASDGELSDVDIGHGLREVKRQRLDAVLPALRTGRTAFETLTFGFDLVDGVASVEDCILKGPDSTLAVEGRTDIGHRALDLAVSATTPDGDSAAPHLRFGIKGSFDQPVVSPDFVTPSTPGAP